MEPAIHSGLTDTLTLRFDGREEDGSALHELNAAHVAEVLMGLVGLTSDFAKAGVFGRGAVDSGVLVRPPQSGSFVIEVVRYVQDHAAVGTLAGIPTLSQVIWWATRAVRADVSDFEHLENGNVKVSWQDNTVQEIPKVAWDELQKRDRRRKKQLREIMAPLSDTRVSSVELQSHPVTETDAAAGSPEKVTLTRADYNAVRPDDDITEQANVFETEAQMSAIDFEDPTKWRVRTAKANRKATVEDKEFLARIANDLPVRKTDIFRLTVREDMVEKNGRVRRKWTVLKVQSHRRAASDSDT